jgi:hypothetical protein
MWKRLFGQGGDEAGAAKQEGDVHALNRPDDPRGGVQSDEYRHARPDEVVEDGAVAMGGPGGAPVEELGVEERRERDRSEEAETG